MLSVGLDLHKRYSQIEVIDEGGNRRAAVRLPNELSELQGFFGSLDEPCRVVLEAGWNWGLMHDWLDGLVPTTYSSGGKTSHGGLMKMSNKWLRWALVEASWVAVRRDPYFRHQFAMRCRHKGSKTAIIAVARRLAEVIWHVLSEDRDYEARQPSQFQKRENMQ